MCVSELSVSEQGKDKLKCRDVTNKGISLWMIN